MIHTFLLSVHTRSVPKQVRKEEPLMQDRENKQNKQQPNQDQKQSNQQNRNQKENRK